MRIDCPSCARTYLISRAALGPAGRHLVCQFCNTRWLVQPGDEISGEDEHDLIAAAEDVFGPSDVRACDGSIESDAAWTADDEAAEDAAPETGYEDTSLDLERQAEVACATGDDAGRVAAGTAFAEELSIDVEADPWTAGANADVLFHDLRARRDAAPATRPGSARPTRARSEPARRKRQRGGLRPAAALAACIILSMALIGKREAIARVLPGTKAIYAAMGLPVHPGHLEFGSVTTARLDGGTTIAVSGTIRNAARQRVAVPRLSFEIRDAAGLVVTRWSENPPKQSLGAGETLAFATKSPVPEGSKDIAVHFTHEAPVKSLREIVGRAPAK